MRGISIPCALFGVLGFFLPWFEVSCGPVRMTMSGYELATGSWEDKFSRAHSDEFWNGVRQQVETDLNRTLSRGGRRSGGRASVPGKPRDNPAKPTLPKETPPKAAQELPLLWAIPVACFLLLLLSLFGLPRVITVIVSALAGAVLAIAAISIEQSAGDPATTGGIVQHSWLFGFWASCVGLLVPAVSALVKSSDPTGGAETAHHA
jgi:hypothetical protein